MWGFVHALRLKGPDELPRPLTGLCSLLSTFGVIGLRCPLPRLFPPVLICRDRIALPFSSSCGSGLDLSSGAHVR